jgi:hypothetical protein
VRAVDEAKVIVEFEAILREGTGKSGRPADRTENIQTGQVALAVRGSSATPTSDQLNGVSACVLVLLRT